MFLDYCYFSQLWQILLVELIKKKIFRAIDDIFGFGE